MNNSVIKFEQLIAEYFGAPFCVAVDSCTHALELSLRVRPAEFVPCPKHTYLSVPMMLEKLHVFWAFVDQPWKGYYHLENGIFDAATLWQPASYIPDSLMCLSFHHKKHLSIGRAGAILCSTIDEYDLLKQLSYDGRDVSIVPWEQDGIIYDKPQMIGYHYYITPETAQLGIERFYEKRYQKATAYSHKDYPDLSTLEIFNGTQNTNLAI